MGVVMAQSQHCRRHRAHNALVRWHKHKQGLFCLSKAQHQHNAMNVQRRFASLTSVLLYAAENAVC